MFLNNRSTKNQAIAYVVAQLTVSVVFSASLLIVDWTAAYSGLAGGLIATLASAWFALKVFGNKHIDEPVAVLRSMYWGEINKIVFTGAMFVAAFVLIKPVNGAALLAVYFLVHIAPLAVDFYIQPKRRRENKESR